MKRPRVTLSNYTEVYRFYREYERNVERAERLQRRLGVILKPKVVYGDGVQQRLTDLVEAGQPLIIASNHVRAIDPLVLTSAAATQEGWSGVLDRVFIPSKNSIFRIPLIRQIADDLGGIPVNRLKDLPGKRNEQKRQVAERALRASGKPFVETCVDKLEDLHSAGWFVEGERNRKDPRRVQELQGGVGLIVCRVTEVPQPPIFPTALFYPNITDLRTPTLFIGEASLEPFQRAKEVMEWLPDQMQASLDAAIGYS